MSTSDRPLDGPPCTVADKDSGVTDAHVIRIVGDAGVPATWDEMTEEQKDASAQAVVRLAMTLDEIARTNDAAATEEAAA